MGVQLFGNNYLNIRNENLLPLVPYGITQDKIGYWAFKDIITNNVISLIKLPGKSIEIEISKSDFYKALHCEIELFTTKSFIQYADFIKSAQNSRCWSFVTLYYFAFFATTSFFRFLRRGFTFLSKEHTQRLENFSLAVYSQPILLDSGNYYFSFKEENALGNVILTLTFRGESLHKLNWYQLEACLSNFIANSDNDEKAIFSVLLLLFANLKTEFPSNIRNKLNYNGDSSILDLGYHIPHINIVQLNSNFINNLLSLDTSPSINNQIYGTAYLANFLFQYNKQLYQEYTTRSGFGRDFQKSRMKYLKDNNINLV